MAPQRTGAILDCSDQSHCQADIQTVTYQQKRETETHNLPDTTQWIWQRGLELSISQQYVGIGDT